MIRTIHLHGGIGRRFGKQFDLDVETPAEAVRALCHMIRGFRDAVSQGTYRVVIGRMGLPADGLSLRFGRETELHLVPAATGAKSAGTGKIIAGVVLLVAAVVTAGFAIAAAPAAGGFAAGTFGASTAGAGFMGASAVGITGVATVAQLGFLGAGLVLTGVSMMLAPQPKASGPLSVDQNPSFMFSGPANTYAQGGPVPIIYGDCRVGSIVGAAALKAEDYTSNTTFNDGTVSGKLIDAVVNRTSGSGL